MGLRDKIASAIRRSPGSVDDALTRTLIAKGVNENVARRAASGDVYARLMLSAQQNAMGSGLSLASQGGTLTSQASSGTIGINDYGFKGKRQYIADRRYLVDLYVVAYNNGDIRTAITHLRNEIFRRGLEWKPAFDYKCVQCDKEYTVKEAKQSLAQGDKYPRCASCGWWRSPDKSEYLDANGKAIPQGKNPAGQTVLQQQPAQPPLRQPDDEQKKPFERFLKEANYFGQSLENVLRECEDDINVIDDAAIFLSKTYYRYEDEKTGEPVSEAEPEGEVDYIFRVDPVLLEFDMDYRGVPGMRHHVCLFHRSSLLDVPTDAGWDKKWQGECPECRARTYPVWFKYNEQYLAGGYGAAQTKVLYLTKDEIVHWSRYTPTETYGYPPILSIYEKALTLIGMDRYLYDYFYERKVPQGIVATTTDDVEGLEVRKTEIQLRMQQDPHYIPWIAVNSRTGQGKTEFVRFAYSLDELNYLPVRDEIRERISGLYGVSNMWLNATEGSGGLNNESQQLVVMSRVVEGAQRSYHVDVFEKMLDAFGVTDWRLEIRTPEQINEEREVNLQILKMTRAQGMAGMGFGVKYNQEEDEFEFTGEVLSATEQQKTQMLTGMPAGADVGGAGGGDAGSGGAPGEGDVGSDVGASEASGGGGGNDGPS